MARKALERLELPFNVVTARARKALERLKITTKFV
jgi:hypothetical protein